MAGVGVWLGGYLSDISGGNIKIYLASLAAALVCGAGNALNDYLDIEADRLNHPKRPLPKGELPPYLAILTAMVFSVIAVVMASMVNWKVLTVVILSLFLLAAYNFKLKRLPLWGNIAIALLSGATFIVGGFVPSGGPLPMFPNPGVPAVFAFLFHLGREWVKDIADFEGDKRADFRTLPSVMTHDSVLALTSVLYAILIILTIVPMYYGWFRAAYGYIAILLVDFPLAVLIAYLWLTKDKNRFGKGASCLKILMVCGLLAFLFGKN